MKQPRVIISGGGTGGHIFPAISIANAVKERYPDAEILFVGAENRMEMTRVPAAGYDIVGLPIAGFNRQKLLKNVSVVAKIFKSLLKANKIIKVFRPDIAIGVGGYASGPLLQIASLRGIPTLIQEQNSYAGITNKFLAGRASVICVAYEGMDKFFPKEKIVLTGNPCRQNLTLEVSKEEAYSFFNLDPIRKTILIVGGSLGAMTINQSILSHLEEISQSGVQFIWQAGEFYYKALTEKLAEYPQATNIHLYDFINRMDFAYKVADLVISRAGAGSISELSLLGKPSILVPSPNVAEDHQTKNAMALVQRDAALMVTDKEASERLIPLALKTVEEAEKLTNLSANILRMAQKDSARRIVDEVEKILGIKDEESEVSS